MFNIVKFPEGTFFFSIFFGVSPGSFGTWQWTSTESDGKGASFMQGFFFNRRGCIAFITLDCWIFCFINCKLPDGCWCYPFVATSPNARWECFQSYYSNPHRCPSVYGPIRVYSCLNCLSKTEHTQTHCRSLLLTAFMCFWILFPTLKIMQTCCFAKAIKPWVGPNTGYKGNTTCAKKGLRSIGVSAGSRHDFGRFVFLGFHMCSGQPLQTQSPTYPSFLHNSSPSFSTNIVQQTRRTSQVALPLPGGFIEFGNGLNTAGDRQPPNWNISLGKHIYMLCIIGHIPHFPSCLLGESPLEPSNF